MKFKDSRAAFNFSKTLGMFLFFAAGARCLTRTHTRPRAQPDGPSPAGAQGLKDAAKRGR